MADLGLIESEINSLPADQRPTFTRIFRAILRDLRLGHPTGDLVDPATNFGGGFLAGVTPATPGDTFTIAHPFGRVPYLVVPVLPLDVVGAALVPLTVSRAADDKRIYLASSVAFAPITLYVEG